MRSSFLTKNSGFGCEGDEGSGPVRFWGSLDLVGYEAGGKLGSFGYLGENVYLATG